jgi:SNF2 family DNA or RNA helicase
MTTKAGGVSITLDRADTVHLLDETWVPDDQEQAEDRIHRASRMHQVTCYYYRTKSTIEEEIADLTAEKADVNEAILDRRRNGYKASKI